MSQPRESSPHVPELGRFRVGEWAVNQAEGTLCSEGRSVRLEPRVMDVLVYLAAEPGRVVSKEELLAAVWSGAFVEEGALTQTVHSLRKALGDDARQPRYVQTIPKRGYRLVAEVLTEPEPEPASVAESLPDPAPTAAPLPPPPRNWVWLSVAIAGVATILALSLFAPERPGEARSVPVEAPAGGSGAAAESGLRIAVLPFTDLGQPVDPIFTIGLTQEITKDLGSFSSLQVIDRTVPLSKEPPKSLDEMRAELAGRGVDYLLMGTVQWERRSSQQPRVRIRPQLIQIDGVQVWMESFDTEVKDPFEVQAEISRQVISELGIELLPEQNLALREPATDSFDAHQAYTRGLDLKDQPFYSHEHLDKAARMFQRAVDLDPEFAAAWAELSQAHSYLAYNTDPTSARMEQAREALDKALVLAPELPEVKLAKAYYAYRCQRDFDSALAQLTAAADLHPNDAEVFKALGLLLRRKGQMQAAIKALKHSAWLDPRTGEIAWILPETYRAMRNFKEAEEGFTQAISQAPDEPFFWEQQALNRLAWTGDVDQARRVLDESGLAGNHLIEAVAFRLDLYEKRYTEALERLSPEWVEKLPQETQARIAMTAAIAREKLGDREGALAAAEANRVDLVKKVELFPSKPLFRACMAVALAQLGRRKEALSHAEEAVRHRRADAFAGPRLIEIQAMVDAMLGRHQQAVDRLTRLLGTSYRGSITATDLRLDPAWEPLHGTKGFKTLLEQRPDDVAQQKEG